jgi:hypothetical protein
MADEAPKSSQHVRHMLIRHGLPGETADRLEIVTKVTGRPHAIRAETTVQRPKVTPASAQAECDNDVQGILRKLPGADTAIRMTMGRTFTVEWAGICRPV